MKLSEKIARIICQGCDENPDHVAGELGHTFRWEDYERIAIDVINAIVLEIDLTKEDK